MAQPAIQTSFASGEWAPKLRSRVDIQKYHAGAALLRNFFVDWSGGGASTRPGTKFIQQTGANGARLIPFQPTANISYVLEFGQNYIRFFSQGAPILSGGVPYQISSPYNVGDLYFNPLTGNPGLKYTQDVTSLILTHPSYPTQVLTIISPTNWALTAANFGTTIGTPTISSLTTTLAVLANGWQYAYTVTAVDFDGQESIAPTPFQTPTGASALKSLTDTTTPGSNILTWAAVPGAQSYNVYKASQIFGSGVTFPVNVPVGFVANTLSTSFVDTTPGIAPDFSQTPPIAKNPFVGAGVQSYTVTVAGTYTVVPTVTVSGGGGNGATAGASLGVTSATLNSHSGGGDVNLTAGSPNPTGSAISFSNATVFTITSTVFVGTSGGQDAWNVTGFSITSPGSITGAGTSTPTNPVSPVGCNATNFLHFGIGYNYNLTWGVTQVIPIQQGASYTSVPTVAFSPAGASATAVLGPASSGNPGVSTFFQERLVLAAQQLNVQDFNMSQPGSFFNFNVSFPIQDDDAISGQIIADDLNAIRSFVNVPTGLITMTNKSAWLLNGGGLFASQNPVTPANIVASQQAFNGANDMRPLKINLNILYGTYKGNYVRDLTYNVYANIFTGGDITTLSNHLFFDTYIFDWCWAEEPFKVVWAVRNDGILLSLTYIKEQELIGWAHHDTDGQFLSVCSVTEEVNSDIADAVYVIVNRVVNNAQVQYVERLADRHFPYGVEDSWSVDCALQTVPQVNNSSILTISGDVSTIGTSVSIGDFTGATPFTPTMATNNWILRTGGGIFKITAYTSSNQVTGTVVRPPSNFNPYLPTFYGLTPGYTIWQPVNSVSGLTNLIGKTVTGVADGVVVPPTVVSGGGSVTLPMTATKITLGLAFTPQLQTLPLDLGEPTVQSKRKKVPALTMRVADTLGLIAGTSFANAVTMKDFQLGAIPTQSNGPALVNDLYSGDGRQILDQVWQEIGQLCVQQNLPYPATILGVMPEVTVGDTPTTEGQRR